MRVERPRRLPAGQREEERRKGREGSGGAGLRSWGGAGAHGGEGIEPGEGDMWGRRRNRGKRRKEKGGERKKRIGRGEKEKKRRWEGISAIRQKRSRVAAKCQGVGKQN